MVIVLKFRIRYLSKNSFWGLQEKFKVVVITDGKSKDDIKTPGRALKKLAHVMAIGVGVKVRTKDLYEIATADEYIYTPESYAELEKLKYEVADKHCPPGCV